MDAEIKIALKIPDPAAVADTESPDDEDLQQMSEILIAAEKIKSNKELMKNIDDWGKSQVKNITSISQLREISNDMAMNPAQYAGQEDVFQEKQSKRLKKKD